MRHRFWPGSGEDTAVRVAADDAPLAPIFVEDELFLDGDRVFVTHYRPRAPSTAFAIIAPPLFEEGARTRKVLVNLARDLAVRGVHAVRFDYPGTGLSAAPHDALTLTGARDALDRMIGWCRERGAIDLRIVGLRFGGYLALSALSMLTRTPLARVVAWEPVLDPAAHFQEALRVEMSNQMVTFGKVRHNREQLIADLRADRSVLVDGNRVAPALYRELDAAAPVELPALAAHKDRLTLITWDSAKLHDSACREGLTSVRVADVRFSWKHIRSLEPRSTALFLATLQALTSEART
jgi:alpha/beta superfamily hydrolase